MATVPWIITLTMSNSGLYTNESSMIRQLLVMGRAFIFLSMIIPWAIASLARQIWYLKYTKYVHRIRVTINIEHSFLVLFILTFLGFIVCFGIVADYDYRLSSLCGKYVDHFQEHDEDVEYLDICEELLIDDVVGERQRVAKNTPRNCVAKRQL